MIAKENKGVNLESFPKETERPSKPALDDFGDPLSGEQEKHLVLCAIGDEVNGVFEMHAIASHEVLPSQKVSPLTRPIGHKSFLKKRTFFQKNEKLNNIGKIRLLSKEFPGFINPFVEFCLQKRVVHPRLIGFGILDDFLDWFKAWHRL